MTRQTRKLLLSIGIPAALLIGYQVWCGVGRHAPVATPVRLYSQSIRTIGTPAGHGNLLSVNPAMEPADYASEARFSRKIDGYLSGAKAQGLLGEKTIVVFPEFLGAWLVVMDEKAGIYRASTLSSAMTRLVMSNGLAFLPRFLSAKAKDRAREAVFRLKARSMAATYQRVFSHLARTYRVSIVPGSIVLPAPRVVAGALSCGDGPLYNVSLLYGANGKAYPAVVRKVFLTADEQGFLAKGRIDELPVFDTPAGRLGILICADAWFPESYARLKTEGAELIVVPSFITGAGKLAKPWQGYSGAPPPADVCAGDVRRITLGAAWRQYAFAGRFPASGAHSGITSCLLGQLWDLGTDGQTTVVSHGRPPETSHLEGEDGMVNLWLE